MTELPALVRADELAIPSDSVWLYTGAEGPPLRVQADAVLRYQSARALGEKGRAAHAGVEYRVRDQVAAMLGLRHDDIALVSNSSEAFNLVAGSIRWQPGDSVVVNDLEYPSVVQPWLRLTTAGVEVRVAAHSGTDLASSSITDLIDESTKVVAVSHVSYKTGLRNDIEALSIAARRSGALFVVDVTQSLGVLPFPAGVADVIICSSYKWLLGGHGIGILAWNQQQRPLPEPPAVGWRSVRDIFTDDRFERYYLHNDARRFEVGFPSYPTLYALESSLDWLKLQDPWQVEDHVLALSGRFVNEFRSRGWDVLTPHAAGRRAGNVSVRTPNGVELAAWLAERGIHCWGGDGRLRVSTHLFNSGDHADRFFETLDRLPNSLAAARQ